LFDYGRFHRQEVLLESNNPYDILAPYFMWIGGCVCVLGLITLCITIYIAYFMYTDANARGQNGVLWALIGVFGGLLGLIIWLLVRPEKKQL
jgi:hypothetical protein